MRINTRVVSDIFTGEILERRSFNHLGAVAKAMGVRFGTVTSTTFVGPLPANNTETTIVASPGLNIALDNAQVIIIWSFTLSAGTGTTSVTVNVRRTAAIGTLVLNYPALTLAAANTGLFSGVIFDTPGVVAQQQYNVTVQQNGASGAGTMQNVALLVMSL